jgi:hypothetical protein
MIESYKQLMMLILKSAYAYSLFASFLLAWGISLVFPKKISINWKTIFGGSLIIFGTAMGLKALYIAIKNM